MMGNIDQAELPPRECDDDDDDDDDAPTTTKPATTLNDLPPEIHLSISQRLTYPDALSLKHTCRYFYNLVDTGIKLKVEWLVERHTLHLECPNDRRCDLRSDLKFCKGSVRYVSSCHSSRPNLCNYKHTLSTYICTYICTYIPGQSIIALIVAPSS